MTEPEQLSKDRAVLVAHSSRSFGEWIAGTLEEANIGNLPVERVGSVGLASAIGEGVPIAVIVMGGLGDYWRDVSEATEAPLVLVTPSALVRATADDMDDVYPVSANKVREDPKILVGMVRQAIEASSQQAGHESHTSEEGPSAEVGPTDVADGNETDDSVTQINVEKSKANLAEAISRLAISYRDEPIYVDRLQSVLIQPGRTCVYVLQTPTIYLPHFNLDPAYRPKTIYEINEQGSVAIRNGEVQAVWTACFGDTDTRIYFQQAETGRLGMWVGDEVHLDADEAAVLEEIADYLKPAYQEEVLVRQ